MKKLIVFILAAVLVSCSQQETFNKEVKARHDEYDPGSKTVRIKVVETLCNE